jgi:hypothetical protein
VNLVVSFTSCRLYRVVILRPFAPRCPLLDRMSSRDPEPDQGGRDPRRSSNVSISFDRPLKRATMAVRIAANGWRAKPFVMIDRAPPMSDLFHSGFSERDTVVCREQNGSMTQNLFSQWADVSHVFVQENGERDSVNVGPLAQRTAI